MKRRTFVFLSGLGAIGTAVRWYWPDQGIFNPCKSGLPDELKHHPLTQKIWQGLNPEKVWDTHVHLIGTGDSGSGIWMDPEMTEISHPAKYLRYIFYMDASCIQDSKSVDKDYIKRLLALHQDFERPNKFMLLAFDYYHDENGKVVKQNSPFYIPNDYAAEVARQYPKAFRWIASIHPYRADSVEALYKVKAQGAQAIKWLPQVMGIDPSDKKCDAFYAACVKLDIPVLSHTGNEHAVANVVSREYGNPLLYRRPLEQGVRIIMAHCAPVGEFEDIDKPGKTGKVNSFGLFTRMMEDKNYESNLYGEISALTQLNHMGEPLNQLILHEAWHARLVNGSDYPLPGIMPVYSMKKLVAEKYLTEYEVEYLSQIRAYNPIYFDLALKRLVTHQGKQFSAQVFESQRVFKRNIID